MKSNQLHVVTSMSNPLRFGSRWRLFQPWVQHMIDSGVKVHVVELSVDERPSQVSGLINAAERLEDQIVDITQRWLHPSVRLVHVRSRSIMWHKENLLNIGVQTIPNFRYVAQIDADVHFTKKNWASETVEMLQEFDVVQTWSHAVDLDPKDQLVLPHRPTTSFMYGWTHGLKSQSGRYDDLNFHPGYGWAYRRDAYVNLGGFFDKAILGSGDRHMAMGLVGMAEKSFHPKVSPAYQKAVMAWQDLAEAHVDHNVGFVPGLIQHGWHGRKRNRGYNDRWQILINNQFDPATDLKRDFTQHGLLEWAHHRTPRMRNLRREVRGYFSGRNEDSVDLE